jgi:hypothetical protein
MSLLKMTHTVLNITTITVFSDVMPCNLVDSYQYFRGNAVCIFRVEDGKKSLGYREREDGTRAL